MKLAFVKRIARYIYISKKYFISNTIYIYFEKSISIIKKIRKRERERKI